MNILMTTSTLPRWENDSELSVVLDIATNLKRYHQNINIFVLAPSYKKAKKREIIKGVVISRYRYFFSFWEKLHYNGGMIFNIKRNKLLFLLLPFSLFFQILSIRRIVKKEKIDIIHAHWIIPQGLIAVIYKKIFNKKIKIICTAHGTDVIILKKIFVKKIKRLILENCDTITTVSKYLENKILQNNFKKNNLRVIHNGISSKIPPLLIEARELKKKYNINSFCLLFVGRLESSKGVAYLLEALPAILLKFPKTKLIIVGDGSERINLEKMVQNLNLENNVFFIGKVSKSEVYSYFSIADIFINPSWQEGFGMVILEALVSGVGVVTTNSGGMTDIIENNKTGIIIGPKNSSAIASSVINLIEDKNKMVSFSLEGEKVVKSKFNWEVVSSKYYKVYEGLS